MKSKIKPRIKLRTFEYTPSHRNEYDPRFWVNAGMYAMLDLAGVPPRSTRKFIVSLGLRLNARATFTTMFDHFKPERLLWLWISPEDTKREFSAEDIRALKPYLAELQEIAGESGARVLRWSKRFIESSPVADYRNVGDFYSVGLMELLAKRNRNYEEELDMAFTYEKQAPRRIRAAYRKNPVGTIARMASVTPKCDFYRTLVDTLTECVRPDKRRGDRWERRVLKAVTDKKRFVEHLRAAHKIDGARTLDFVDLCGADFQRRADRVLGAAFRRARKARQSDDFP